MKIKRPKCANCEHCTDEFWDYTNGPYMWACELHKENDDLDWCKIHNEKTTDKNNWIEIDWEYPN